MLQAGKLATEAPKPLGTRRGGQDGKGAKRAQCPPDIPNYIRRTTPLIAFISISTRLFLTMGPGRYQILAFDFSSLRQFYLYAPPRPG